MASVTVSKTIGSTGVFSTPQLWEDGSPANLTTAEQSPANTFTAGFVQGEALTFTGSGATGTFLDTDGSTYITYGLTAGNPASGDVVSGATGLCTLTSSTPTFTGVIWQGQCQNQEFSGAGTQLLVLGSTSSSTAYEELTTVPGASFRDHVDVQTHALHYNATNGAAIRGTSDATISVLFEEPHSRISNLQVSATGLNSRSLEVVESPNYATNLIVEGTYTNVNLGRGVFACDNATVSNVVVIQRASGADHIVAVDAFSPSFYNCTFVAAEDLTVAPTSILMSDTGGTVTIQNCGLFAGDSTKALTQGSSTFNFTTCYSDISGTGGVTQTTYANEFQNVNDATRDFRLKAGAAQINTGTTDTTNAAIDIAGTARPQGAAYDVGAWEFVQAAPGESTVTWAGAIA